MADPPVLRTLSVFSGVAGLDLGLDRGLSRVGRSTVPVCMVEREAFAAACLVAAMERGDLAPCPVWLGDVCEFDARPFAGRVDLVLGGFPCQDISHAGRGEGLDGAKSGLWFELERIIRDAGPRYVFLENVAAITVRGLDRVLRSLAELGFDAEWLCVRASDVGAPHQRNRWFCLAYASDDHGRRGERGEEEGTWASRGGRRGSPSRGADLADADEDGRLRERRGRLLDRERPAQRNDAERCGERVAVAGRERPQGQRAPGATPGATERGGGVPAWPPGPGDRIGWERVIAARPDLAPALDARRSLDDARGGRHREPPDALRAGRNGSLRAGDGREGAPATQSAVRRVADGPPDRVDGAMRNRTHRLRALGNGVVPEQAAAAFVELWTRMEAT